MKQRTNGTAVQQKLLLISDQGGFSRDVIARWQMQPHLPEFTALSTDLWHAARASSFDLAIAGDLRGRRSTEVLVQLNRNLAPTIYIAGVGESAHGLRREYSRLIVIPRHDAWLDTLVLLAEEILKRVEVAAHIERIEENARGTEANAMLGRYMVDMRHSFNNALTSVLGNAELLMLETSALTPGMREQLETLHMMTLRLHEMMQRFTSLEQEMQCVERSSQTGGRASHSFAVRE
jgi:signal transduction histidine kinase